MGSIQTPAEQSYEQLPSTPPPPPNRSQFVNYFMIDMFILASLIFESWQSNFSRTVLVLIIFIVPSLGCDLISTAEFLKSYKPDGEGTRTESDKADLSKLSVYMFGFNLLFVFNYAVYKIFRASGRDQIAIVILIVLLKTRKAYAICSLMQHLEPKIFEPGAKRYVLAYILFTMVGMVGVAIKYLALITRGGIQMQLMSQIFLASPESCTPCASDPILCHILGFIGGFVGSVLSYLVVIFVKVALEVQEICVDLFTHMEKWSAQKFFLWNLLGGFSVAFGAYTGAMAPVCLLYAPFDGFALGIIAFVGMFKTVLALIE